MKRCVSPERCRVQRALRPAQELMDELEKEGKSAATSDLAKGFQKDWTRLTHSGRDNMMNLKTARLLMVANDGPSPTEYLAHTLPCEWGGQRSCRPVQHCGG